MASPPRYQDPPPGQGSDPSTDTSPDETSRPMGESWQRTGETAREEVRNFASAATGRIRSEAERQRDEAARSIDDFADALHRAGDELGGRDQSTAARFVKEAAGGLESLSRSLSRRKPEEMLDEVRKFGRSNPTAFLAGSILAGVALGRFALASGERHESRTYRTPSVDETPARAPTTTSEYPVAYPDMPETPAGTTPSSETAPGGIAPPDRAPPPAPSGGINDGRA